MMQNIQNRMFKPMTNFDLERYIGKNKIVKYSNLDELYTNIYELLPLPIDFRIILFETTRDSGHWVSVIRNDKKKEMIYLDSYGSPLGTLYRNVSKNSNITLGNQPNAILDLLKTRRKNIKLIVNTFSFQSITLESETCGRWVILIIKLYLDYGYSLKEIYGFVKNKQEQMKYKHLDEVAAYYII
jgi:hypothetical protein